MAAPSFSRKSVLIVEDETLLRLIAIEMFEDAGFTVFAAETADEGEAILEDARQIDSVFTDIETPGRLDGLGLARITHDLYPDAAILIVSGRRYVDQSQLPPRARFLGKPYRHAVVFQTLHELFNDS